MIGHEEHERTMTLAKTALGQIKALKQSAAPFFYEIWYTYATGHNPALNQTINDLISANGNLTKGDFDRIHDRYFSPTRIADEFDSAGARFLGEIEQTMAILEDATSSATKRTTDLATVSDQIGRTVDKDSLRQLVGKLVLASKDMEGHAKLLEDRLNQSRTEISKLQTSLEALRTESLTDPLTGLANRKLLDEILAKRIAEVANDEPLCLMLIDIDYFKKFNDSYGHLTGDQVLRLVGRSLKQNVSARDLAARHGGEEFAVVLPNTNLSQAMETADQIRRTVMGKELMKRSTGEMLGRVTISIGVATLRNGETPGSLMERADVCLYAAKRNGRNRVIGEADAEASPQLASQVA